ncbi:CBS domain-containing protein [Romeria aff. gracilis LEGE 07310]|uniref:CBS domain-containing protein n=1 Tax=Vasconcelosia minhoensis LEGE 07310 TaxID=915328 RepID=A0A8J7DCY9_9CYAN|nr:CBS domain-containing protein [Romeria gracilis]MBE9079372.1 CBS domain-containing protein [Romeria aff. gracilis LEGE 07310]
MAKTVGEVMTAKPLTVHPETPIKEAIMLLADNRISGLPVVDEANQIVGVLSEADLMWQTTGATLPPYVVVLDSVIYLTNPAHYNQELHKALGQTVAEVMTAKAITIPPDQSLRHAAQLMHDKQVRRLIVVDEANRTLGVLTRGDIVREMASRYADDTEPAEVV